MPNNNNNTTLAGYGFLTALLLVPSSALAAGFDIWIYKLNYHDNQQQWTVTEGRPVTERDGYDNQPSFTPDSSQLLFTSDRQTSPSSSSHTSAAHNDIYQFHIADNHIEQITFTPKQSEYSPQAFKTHTPNKQITYVVEQGVPHQSVWQQTGSTPRQRAINSLIPAGYYAINQDLGTLIWARYAYSLYFEPNGKTADERHFVAANVGRSIHSIPNDEAFSYLHKQLDGDRVIKRYSPIDNSHTALIALASGASEDYAWSQNNWLFNINNGQLLGWNQTSQESWQLISPIPVPNADYLSASRLVISPDNQHLAIVWLRK
ncbi:TolB family protein [Shewanella sp. 125m-7]